VPAGTWSILSAQQEKCTRDREPCRRKNGTRTTWKIPRVRVPAVGASGGPRLTHAARRVLLLVQGLDVTPRRRLDGRWTVACTTRHRGDRAHDDRLVDQVVG